MSTLDPGLEPPGDWRSPYTPPPGRPGGPTEAANKAAVYVWLCAGLSLLTACCCVFTALGLAIVPTDELIRQLPADLPNREQVIQALPTLGVVMGIFGVLLMLIPAVTLGLLGFPVRSGSRGASIASMIVLGIQAGVLGLMLLTILAGVLINGAVGDMIVVIILASMMAVFVRAIFTVWSALNSRPSSQPTPVDPWGY